MKRAYAALGLPFNAGNGSANINPVIQRNQTVAVPHGQFLFFLEDNNYTLLEVCFVQMWVYLIKRREGEGAFHEIIVCM